jgi:uncharacterized LabA/DUF88 family protein
MDSGNRAFIDGANLHKGVESLGWRLDYGRFRTWLREKHHVSSTLLFIGYLRSHEKLYAYLRESGYTLVFKETTRDGRGNTKGNCDADLVLEAVRGSYENRYRKAIVVSSDGDYASLVKFLLSRNGLKSIVSPSNQCSVLLMRTGASITYMRDIRPRVEKLPKNERAPGADGTAAGSLSW